MSGGKASGRTMKDNPSSPPSSSTPPSFPSSLVVARPVLSPLQSALVRRLGQQSQNIRSMCLKDASAGKQTLCKIANNSWVINPVLKTLLLGTVCPSSPLRHLRVSMKLHNLIFESISSATCTTRGVLGSRDPCLQLQKTNKAPGVLPRV